MGAKIPLFLCSTLQGNIVSCTKTQICLWTVNGTLLATNTIHITGNFKLLCCAVSEVQCTLYMYMYFVFNYIEYACTRLQSTHACIYNVYVHVLRIRRLVNI